MAEISNYHVSSSPHKLGNQSTRKIMLDVIIALIPCVVCGVVFYGLYALMLVAICVATCFISEQVYNKIRKKPITTDLSAIVTGIILGLNLPPRAEWYIPIIGGVFAIIVVKMFFGGIGKNFANPAATARVFLLLAYGSMGTKYIVADVGNMLLGDVSTSATFLSGGAGVLSESFFGVKGYWRQVLQLLFGYVGGSIGETCAIAVIIGGVYLIIKRVIDWKIPVVYLTTSALMVLICYQSASEILLQLFAGGLMFGAVFMATDYATSPKWKYNRILYAIGLGVLTILIRRFGAYPEGVSFSILIMNIFVPMMDKYIVPVRFGQTTKKGKPCIPFFKYVMLILCTLGVLSLAIATPIVAVNQAQNSKFEKIEIGLNYNYVNSINKNISTGDYNINASGVAAIPWDENFYNVDLEYNFVIDASNFKIKKITPVRQSTSGEQYTLKTQLFENKSLNEILSVSADLFTGATYTHNEFIEMVKESYRALNDAGIGVTEIEYTGEYNYVKRVKTSEFFNGYIVNVQGKAVLADQGDYEQALEFNVVIENDKVVYIGAIKQSTFGYSTNTQIFIGKTSVQINAIADSELTGATYSNSALKEMVSEAFDVADNIGGNA